MRDAETEAPTVCITLTTNDPATTPATYRNGSAYLFKRLRAMYGRVDYFGSIEFTTGRAATSGGHRRLHGHYLVKGIDPRDVLDVEALTRRVWSASTGAYVVEVAALISAGAALGYLGLHHRKPSQAPPAEWRGMTERHSRGYWTRPIATLRQEARLELAAEALAHRTGMPRALALLDVANREPSRLIEVRQLGDATVLEPMGEVFAGGRTVAAKAAGPTPANSPLR